MKATPVLAALAVAAALIGGGCSTDYQGGDKDRFVADANAICRADGATITSRLDELIGNGRLATKAELRSFAGDVALPRLQERVDKLRRLEPPSADRHDIDEILRAYQKGIDVIRADPMQLADADPLLDAYTKAGSYGLSACAE